MRKLSALNWRILLNTDTPPCVSIIIQCKGKSKATLRADLLKIAEPCEELIKKSYGQRTFEILKINEEIERLLENEKTFLASSLGIFIGPDLSAFALFSETYPDICVVSQSFHIKPFLLNRWQWPSLGLYFTKNSLEVFVSDRFHLEPMGTFEGLEDFWKNRTLPPQLTMVIGGHKKRVQTYFLRGMPNGDLINRFVDVGNPRRDEFFEQLPLIVQAHHDGEEERLIRNLRIDPTSTVHAISDKILNQSSSRGVFASELTLPLWGRFSKSNKIVDIYETQRDGFDDCVVDELFEASLRKGNKTYLVHPKRWKLAQPFIYNEVK